MNILLFFLSVGFIGGQITAFSLSPDVKISLLDIAVSCLVIFAAYKTGKDRFIPKLWLPILAFPAIAIASGGNLFYITRWLLYASLYWAAADAIFPPAKWLTVLMWSGGSIAALGFVQYVWYPDLRNLYYLGWDPHYQRLFSTLLDPNFAGIMLALTSLLLLHQKRFGLLVFTASALVLTYSRSSLVAFAVGVLVWGVFMKRKTFITILFGILAVTLLVLPQTGEGRNLFRTVSTYARVDSAKQAIEQIKENPLFGHGIRPRLGIDTSLLFVGATTGIVGLMSYGWLIISLFRLGKLRKNSLYIASLVAMLVHSLFVNSLFYPWVMAWLWIMTGALERKNQG